MGFFNKPFKAIKSFCKNPIRAMCTSIGINYEIRTIRDAAQDQRAHEMSIIRNNNKYVKKVKEYGIFGELEEAIDYKEWLVSNGAHNIHSPYFSCHETSTKQDTRAIGFNGHPNIYIGWEDRFNYNAYNRDLANAQAAIRACKQQIHNEKQECKAAINNYACQKGGCESELLNIKKIYNYAQNEYNLLTQKDQQLNRKINEQQLSLQSIKNTFNAKSEQLVQLCNQINKEYNTTLNINSTDALTGKLVEKQQECNTRLHHYTSDDRTKLFFEIFGTEKADRFSAVILNEGINFELLAYMAVKFDQQSILEYALARGACLDVYFVDGKTTIEHMIDTDAEKYSQIILNHNAGMFNTIINAAENGRVNILQELYKLNNDIFISNDNVTCYTAIHLAVLNDFFESVEYMLSTNPDAINVRSIAGNSLLKTSLNAGSTEMSIFLMSRIDNLEDEIKNMIVENEIDLAIKAISIYGVDVQTRISIIHFALQNNYFDLVEELLQSSQEINLVFKEILVNNDLILAGKFYQIFHNNEVRNELDEILLGMNLSEETKNCFEFFTVDIEVTSSEYAELVGIAESINVYEHYDQS